MNKSIIIGHGETMRVIGGNKVFIIAEIGKNFIQTKENRPLSEYLNNAKKLIDAAIYAGVDAVKFQTHELEDEQLDIPITSPHFKGSDRYNWIKRNMEATPFEFWKELSEYSKQKGILFFSTPMSKKAAQKLEKIGIPLWKIGSGDVDDYLMLDFVSKTKKPIIISSGMVSLNELEDVIRFVRKNNSQLGLLYCVSQYPCPKEAFNLGTIEYFIEKYPDIVIGFSDHSITDEASLSAVKMGAKIIEKHFTLDRGFWGSDHKVSLLPEEMKNLVFNIRSKNYQGIDTSLYYGNKSQELEGANNMFRPYFKKALVASRELKIGDIIKSEDVYSMRPRMYIGGLPSFEYPNILGKKVGRNLRKYEFINWDMLE